MEYKKEKREYRHRATKRRKRIINGGKKERGQQNEEVKWNREKKERKKINERIKMSE